MDLNVIISGNLTGFSQIYATPGAKELYVEGNFDFDYRKFLTFLKNGEKAYAISFAPRTIAVSLVTRTLDSFRRSGILVISILLQRKQTVESMMNPHDKNALYQLLNELNDKFYERNLVNGMINQNAAVLMQDYYSDILSNYKLVADVNQRLINSHIDVTTPNKRWAYLASKENDIPLYISSPYRRSYEGYHHVFFAPNAPQNIEEPPVEEVMYRVRITNNDMILPSMVKLTDQIYRLTPQEGEIPFDQNFTYGDVLQGKADNRIQASIDGETIEITYRFKQEEKTISFEFVEDETDKPISLALVSPRIEGLSNEGGVWKLFTETLTFTGKDIYGRKRIVSNSSNYIISPESSNLDLRSFKDGEKYRVRVIPSTVLHIQFPNRVDKKITLRNRINNKVISFDAKDALNEKITGRSENWDFTITTSQYEPIRGLLPTGGTMILNLEDFVSKKDGSITTDSDTPIKVVHPDDDTQVSNNTKRRLKLFRATGNETLKQRWKNGINIKKVLLAVLPLFVILLYIGISWQFKFWPWNESSSVQEFVTGDSLETKIISYELLDITGASIMDDSDYNEVQALEPYLSDVECLVYGNITKKDTICPTNFVLMAPKGCNDNVNFKLKFDGVTICDTTIIFNKFKDKDIVKLKMDVRTSAIVLYKKIRETVEKKETLDLETWNDYKKAMECLDKNLNKEFRKKLEVEFRRIEQPTCVNDTAPNMGLNNQLDEICVTYNDLRNFSLQEDDPLYEEKKNRLDLLRSVLQNIRKGELPITSEGFSKVEIYSSVYKCKLSQKEIIDALIATKEKMTEGKYKKCVVNTKFKVKSKDVAPAATSLHQMYQIVKDENSSIYKGKK